MVIASPAPTSTDSSVPASSAPATSASASSARGSEAPGAQASGADHRPDDPTARRASYALAMSVYVGAVATAGVVLHRRGIRLPQRVDLRDLAVTALATQRLSRVIAKDPITSPLRAPFTEYVGVSGPAQLDERARDDSKLRHTVGELLTCPFCLGQWVGTGFVLAQVVWPRAGRLAASTFAAIGVADMLHHVEAKLRAA